MPTEAPILGKGPISAEQGRKNGWRAIGTLILIATIFATMMVTVQRLGDFLHSHPRLANVFPLVGGLSVASIVPLVVYLGYQEDFPDINPLIPTHYFRLARRCFAAMANPENKGKVTGKDL